MTVWPRDWQRSFRNPMARNAGWLMAGQGAGLLLQVAYFIILARLLGAVQYGIYAGAFAFTGLVAQYGGLGTGTVFLRYVSGDRREFSVYWGNILAVTLVAAGSLIVLLRIVGWRVLNPASASLVLLAAVANCLCGQLTLESSRIFQAFEQMRTTAVLNLLTNLLRTIAAAGMLLVLGRASAWQWAAASATVSAIGALLAAGTITARFGRPEFHPALFAKRGPEGLGYAFATSTASVYNDLDKTMLSHYGLNLANGIYTMAYRVIDVATIPILSIRDAAMPRLFQRGRSNLAASAELSYRLLRRAAPIGVAASVAVFLAAPLIPRILGPGFAESVAAARWLCLIPAFRGVHQMTGSALTGAGLQSYRTNAQLTAAALNFGLNLWLIPRFGWYGAAWSSLATDAALGGMNWGLLQWLILRGQRNPVAESN